MTRPRPHTRAQDIAKEMNFALGTLARAVSNLDRAARVFAGTPRGDQLAVALDDAREAYNWLRSDEGKAARRAVALERDRRERELAANRPPRIPF